MSSYMSKVVVLHQSLVNIKLGDPHWQAGVRIIDGSSLKSALVLTLHILALELGRAIFLPEIIVYDR